MKKQMITLILALAAVQGFAQNIDSTVTEASFAQSRFAASLPETGRFTSRQLYASAALILSGFIANGHSQESIKNEVAEERNEHIPHFKTSLDDYLQFSPLALAYGLDALGVKSKTYLLNRSVILLKGGAGDRDNHSPEKSISYIKARRQHA